MKSRTGLMLSRLALALVLAALVAPSPGAQAKSVLVKREEPADESPDVAGGERDGSRSDDLTSDYPTTVSPDAKLDGSRNNDESPAGARSGLDEPESRGDESTLTTEAPKSAADDSRGDEAAMTSAKPDGESRSDADSSEEDQTQEDSKNLWSGSKGDLRGDEHELSTTPSPDGVSRSGAKDYSAGDDSRDDDDEAKTTAKPEGSSRSNGGDLGGEDHTQDEGDDSKNLWRGSKGDLRAAEDGPSTTPSPDGISRSGFTDEDGEGSRADLDEETMDQTVELKSKTKPKKHAVPHPRPYFTSPTPGPISTKKPAASKGDGDAPTTTKKPVPDNKQPPLKKVPDTTTTKLPRKPPAKATTTKRPAGAKPTSKKPSPGSGKPPQADGGLGLDPGNLKPLQKGDQVLVLVKSKAGKIEARLPSLA